MAISIGGTVVIDDSRNIVNVNDIRVGLVTITGSTGNIQTPGTITGAGFGVAGTGFSVSPGIGSTGISPSALSSIILSFPTSVTRGTGTIKISSGSTNGTTIRSYDAATAPEITVLNNTWSLNTTPVGYSTGFVSPVLPFGETVFLTIPSTAITGFVGLNTTGAGSYSFSTSGVVLGSALGGGLVICRSEGINRIVSTSAAEVSRNWYNRTDANTRAQQVSGCTGWFIPSFQQLQNPGSVCRQYWDSYSNFRYWSNTPTNTSDNSWRVCIQNGAASTHGYAPPGTNLITSCIRAFRCVSY